MWIPSRRTSLVFLYASRILLCKIKLSTSLACEKEHWQVEQAIQNKRERYAENQNKDKSVRFGINGSNYNLISNYPLYL